jgi:hypothetical protein
MRENVRSTYMSNSTKQTVEFLYAVRQLGESGHHIFQPKKAQALNKIFSATASQTIL